MPRFLTCWITRGGDEGSGTRSSLMYETLRIVNKLKPKYVIWENVKNLLSKKHKHNFDAYIQRMEQMGYKSYYQVLNAKDYGIPQNRERVFTISILDHNKMFCFPKRQSLKLKLKDMLDDEVDEKYYLSELAISGRLNTNYQKYKLEENIVNNKDVHPTILARFEGAPTLYSKMEKQLFTEDGNIKRYINSDIIDEFEEGQMATTSFPNGYGHGSRTHDESICLNCIDKPSVKTNLRIRKLTPKECFRLMGFSDEDYLKASKVNSNAQLYKPAGNSIVVNVLMEILKKLLLEDNNFEGQMSIFDYYFIDK